MQVLETRAFQQTKGPTVGMAIMCSRNIKDDSVARRGK